MSNAMDLLNFNTIILRPQKDGSFVPTDEMGFMWTRQEWLAMVAKADRFYESVSSDEIEQHNHALLVKYGQAEE